MFYRLQRMLVKEFLQMLRDPRMRAIIFVVPVVQMAVLAFALTTDVRDIATAVLDRDRTPASREVLDRFFGSGYFELTAYLDDDRQIDPLMDASTVRAALTIPSGFEARILSGQTAKLQVLADGTDSISAQSITAYANQIAADYAQELQAEKLARRFGASFDLGQISFDTRAWFNPNLDSRKYYVPGLIAVMMLVVSMMLSSISIVREKEIGTIEQVMVTPIRRLEFILGKTIPYLIVGYIIMTAMLAIAVWLFHIPVKGSLFLLYGVAGIYLIGNLGLALLVSVTAATQQQALLTAFFILLPGVLLSGFMFPVRNMPLIVQYITLLNPMRWFLEVLRGVVLRGVGADVLYPQIAAQTILAILFTTLAASRFKKTLE